MDESNMKQKQWKLEVIEDSDLYMYVQNTVIRCTFFTRCVNTTIEPAR